MSFRLRYLFLAAFILEAIVFCWYFWDTETFKIFRRGRVRPYLMEIAPNVNSVTYSTQFTMDRLYMMDMLLERWNGPITACIFSSNINKDMKEAEKYHDRVDFFFVPEYSGPYPINMLRNVALVNVRTNFVFLSDVDFLPSTTLHEHFVSLTNNFLAKRSNELIAFVVPAFELKVPSVEIPKTKAELIQMFNNKQIDMVHNETGKSLAHRITDYQQWMEASEPYRVLYQMPYEPYIMASKILPLYDESFIGYGHDKTEHLYELNVMGYQLWVVPDGFIVHKDHAASSKGWGGDPDRAKRIQRTLEQFFIDVNERHPDSEPLPPVLPPSLGFQVITAENSENCVTACNRHQLNCDIAYIEQVNSCRALRKHFRCRGCSKYFGGDFIPVWDTTTNNLCLANPDHNTTKCEAYAIGRRLCPCIKK